MIFSYDMKEQKSIVFPFFFFHFPSQITESMKKWKVQLKSDLR